LEEEPFSSFPEFQMCECGIQWGSMGGSALDIGQISKTHKKKDASRKGAKALKK